jgi:6,7-dimethyl-8-ribityllumazine synthase
MPKTTSSASGNRSKSALPRVAIVVSRYNASITDRLLEGALAAFEDVGGSREDVTIVPAAGSWELIALCMAACDQPSIEGVAALGCIIKGETTHDRVLADAVAKGLVDVMMTTGTPVSLGVLTVENVAQAQARAGGDQGNKGAEAMLALIETIRAADALRTGKTASHELTRAPHDKASMQPRTSQKGTSQKRTSPKRSGSNRKVSKS